MLEHLHIQNLALIEDMSLDFSGGMNVLTGETGAGKSFILKAISFVLGDKLDAGIIRPGAERAQVEALFLHQGKELILRRELIAASGRSRFYINGSLGSQEALRELRPKLLSHTGQHAQQQLLNPQYQAALLENCLADRTLLNERDDILARLRSIAREIDSLKEKQGTLSEKREFLELQEAEIDKVNPRAGEEEELEEIRAAVRANENARKLYGSALAILHGDEGPGLLDQLKEFRRAIAHINDSDPLFTNAADAADALYGQLAELSSHLKRPPANSRHADMDAIEERLFALSQLKRKLKRTMPQILDLKKEIRETLSFLDVCALDLSRLKREEKKAAEELGRVVAKLAPLRQEAAEAFCSQLESQLRDLGFSEHARVFPEFTRHEIWPGINDSVGRLLWAPNPGQPPLPLEKIASGGELSRFLLALNTDTQDSEDVTFIFDEVDAGVGGLTLKKVAEKLQDFASSHQVLLITHWPQLAARAQAHFQIAKSVQSGATYTECFALTGDKRAKEIARMAGGGKEGEQLARNLLGR